MQLVRLRRVGQLQRANSKPLACAVILLAGLSILSICVTFRPSSILDSSSHATQALVCDTDVMYVIARHDEDVAWTATLPGVSEGKASVTVYSRDPNHPPYVLPNVGQEAPVFLTYIIDNFDTLPNIVMFLHGHGPGSWHDGAVLVENPSLFYWPMAEVLQRYSLPGQGEEAQRLNFYHSLNFCYESNRLSIACQQTVSTVLEKHKSDVDVADADADAHRTHVDEVRERTLTLLHHTWQRVFERMIGFIAPPPLLRGACCAQFAVSRDRIRKHSLDDYQRILDWLLSLDPLQTPYSSRAMEYLWPTIFGEIPDQIGSQMLYYVNDTDD